MGKPSHQNGTRIGKARTASAVWALEHGFEGPLASGRARQSDGISEQDILGDRCSALAKRKAVPITS